MKSSCSEEVVNDDVNQQLPGVSGVCRNSEDGNIVMSTADGNVNGTRVRVLHNARRRCLFCTKSNIMPSV